MTIFAETEPRTLEGWIDWIVRYNHLMPWREENLRFSAKLALERYAEQKKGEPKPSL